MKLAKIITLALSILPVFGMVDLQGYCRHYRFCCNYRRPRVNLNFSFGETVPGYRYYTTPRRRIVRRYYEPAIEKKVVVIKKRPQRRVIKKKVVKRISKRRPRKRIKKVVRTTTTYPRRRLKKKVVSYRRRPVRVREEVIEYTRPEPNILGLAAGFTGLMVGAVLASS